MKRIKWRLFIFAILTAASMMGIGIELAEKSMIGTISCAIATVLILGFGFKTKRKMRENGEL